jgi:hypothetical protein
MTAEQFKKKLKIYKFLTVSCIVFLLDFVRARYQKYLRFVYKQPLPYVTEPGGGGFADIYTKNEINQNGRL